MYVFVICSIILLRRWELHKKLPNINFLSMYRTVSLVQKTIRELEIYFTWSNAMLLDLLKQNLWPWEVFHIVTDSLQFLSQIVEIQSGSKPA